MSSDPIQVVSPDETQRPSDPGLRKIQRDVLRHRVLAKMLVPDSAERHQAFDAFVDLIEGTPGWLETGSSRFNDAWWLFRQGWARAIARGATS